MNYFTISIKNFINTDKKIIAAFIIVISLFVPLYAQERPAVPTWRAALNGMMIGNPAAQVESVAVILDSGNLSCYSRHGNFLWTYFAGGKLGPFITRTREGTAYICRTNGTLIAVNRSGRELWRKPIGETLAAPVIAGWDGRIFVPTAQGIFCYTAAGFPLWSLRFETSLVFGPIKDLQGGVIVGLEGGKILHINHFGESKTFELSENPALVVPLLYHHDAEETEEQLILIAAGQNGHLSILGEERSGETPLPSLPAPPLQAASRNGNIAFTLPNSQLVLVSYKEKSIVWTGQSQNLSSSSMSSIDMIYDERGIYVVSQNGASGFTEDGRRLWIINIRGSAAMPVFSDEGILYSGGTDWILYAYRLEERVLGTKRSIYGPAPEGSYGLDNPGPSSWDGFVFRNEEKEVRRYLNHIEETILAGRTGSSEREFTAYLMETAAAAITNPGGRDAPSIQAAERIKAIRLLSYIGSRETIPFLAEIFRRDPDTAVEAAAARAIGRIGVDPDGTALKAFNMKLYSPAVQRSEQVLLAVTESAASLCRFSGPPLSEAAIRLLTMLAGSTMPPSVRNQARRELDDLH